MDCTESFAMSATDKSFTGSIANSLMPSFSLSHSFDSDLDDVTVGSFDVPDLSCDELIDESLPINAVAAELPQVEHFIMPSFSMHEKNKLVNNLGFSYTVKWPKGNISHWRCAIHNSKIHCKATACSQLVYAFDDVDL